MNTHKNRETFLIEMFCFPQNSSNVLAEQESLGETCLWPKDDRPNHTHDTFQILAKHLLKTAQAAPSTPVPKFCFSKI